MSATSIVRELTPVQMIMAKQMGENDLLISVIDAAKTFGYTVYHARPAMNRRGVWSTPTQGDNGFPDLAMARKGQVIFAELKTEKGKVLIDQQNWLEELEGIATKPGTSVSVYLWRPSDWLSGQIEAALI